MSSKPKIVIAGGSGLLGSLLCRAWKNKYDIFVLSTSKVNDDSLGCRFVYWDAKNTGNWCAALEGTEAVINFSGKNINCRHTRKNIKQIIDSRVLSTQIIGKAITNCVTPPKLWINASGTAIYGNSDTEPHTEAHPATPGFLSDITTYWEQSFYNEPLLKTRRVCLRIGVVLTKKGGVLGPLKTITSIGLGGKAGNGKQYVSWIHEHDFIKLIEFCMIHESIHGPINAVAPNPVTNNQFMQALRKAMKISFGLPVSEFALRIGAFFIGTQSDLILASRRDIPLELKMHDFAFDYPVIDSAFKNLIK